MNLRHRKAWANFFFSTEGVQVLTRSVSLSFRDLFTGPRKRSGCLGLVGTVGS